MTTDLVFTLPFPPSVNRLWRNVRGKTLKSAEYRTWLLEAKVSLIGQKVRGSIAGRYHLEVYATAPDRRARDLGNLEKALSDLIVACGVIEDDSLAQSIHLEWCGEPIKGGAMLIKLRSAE